MHQKKWFLIVCVTAATFEVGLCGDQPRSGKAESAIRKLFDADNYKELEKVVLRWRAELSEETQKEVLNGLCRNLGSKKALKLVGNPKVYVAGVPHAEEKNESIIVVQDVFSEGGRSAWAIERLLDLKLSPWKGEESYRPIVEAVIGRMNMPVSRMTALEKLPLAEQISILEKLPVADRVALARTKATAANEASAIFVQLAKDREVEVRMAIATNSTISPPILVPLLKDRDENVRRAVRQNWRTFAAV